MPNIKISAAVDAGTLLSSDMLPLARSGDTNAYHATMSEIATFANTSLASGAYGNIGRNLIHNALFNVAQRGTGPWTAPLVYTLDRWLINANLDTFSVTQNVLNDANRAAIGDEAAQQELACIFTGNAGAAAATSITQYIENLHRLSGKTVTVSFWAACLSGSLKFGCSVDQNFGTGGSPSTPVQGNGQSVTLSTTFTRYSLTFTLPSAIGKTLGTNGNDNTQLNFWYSAGSNSATRSGSVGVQSGTIGLWGVQLEIGGVSTPLEKLDPQQDLAKCVRFYQIIKASARFYASAGGQTMDCTVTFPSMRTSPTITPGAADANANISAATLYILTYMTNSARFEITSQAVGDAYGLGYAFFLSADL